VLDESISLLLGSDAVGRKSLFKPPQTSRSCSALARLRIFTATARRASSSVGPALAWRSFPFRVVETVRGVACSIPQSPIVLLQYSLKGDLKLVGGGLLGRLATRGVIMVGVVTFCPRATIRSAFTGSGRCSVRASFVDAVIQRSTSLRRRQDDGHRLFVDRRDDRVRFGRQEGEQVVGRLALPHLPH
jgi:hypothetical protein